MRRKADHYVYSKHVGDHFINIVLYVDDMLLIGNNKDVIKEVKYQLSSKFDMKNLNSTKFITVMEIKRYRPNMKIWLNKTKYVETKLQIFNMQESKSVKVHISMGVNLSLH